jgi:hypothetical protein
MMLESRLRSELILIHELGPSNADAWFTSAALSLH